MILSRRISTAFWLGVLLLLGGTAGARPPGPQDARPQELLVKFAARPAAETLAAEARRLSLSSATPQNLQRTLLTREGLEILGTLEPLAVTRVRVPAGHNSGEIIRRLLASPLIRYVEPNYQRRLLAPLLQGPDDPEYQAGKQWWLEQIQADRVFAESLLPAGAPVTIAIVDTGIMLAHEDLAARLVAGVDYVDPAQNGNEDPAGAGDPYYGHGTHVAGIAAASTNNHLGIAGTACADSVRLMPVRVFSSDGVSYDYDIARGLLWAADHGARVMNLSSGGTAAGQVLQDAIQNVFNRGCVVVASAGNNAVDDYGRPYNPVIYPAAYGSVIAVAACDSTGARAWYSEYGDFIDLAAPGGVPSASGDFAQAVYSTFPNAGVGTYAGQAGTSMAAPMVAGAAAMLLTQDPGLSPEEVRSRLTATADKTGIFYYSQGWNPYLGWGRMNLYRALTLATTFQPKSSGPASYNYPNPFRPGVGEMTYILLPIRGGQTVSGARLRIFDALGKLVHDQEIPAAALWPGGVIGWDGRNDLGHPVANGVYPYCLEIDGTRYTNKIAVGN